MYRIFAYVSKLTSAKLRRQKMWMFNKKNTRIKKMLALFLNRRKKSLYKFRTPCMLKLTIRIRECG